MLRKGDTFVAKYAGLNFRALRELAVGEEVTFSYCLEEADLAKDFSYRRKRINARGWTFLCHCERCSDEVQAFLKQARKEQEGDETDYEAEQTEESDLGLLFSDSD